MSTISHVDTAFAEATYAALGQGLSCFKLASDEITEASSVIGRCCHCWKDDEGQDSCDRSVRELHFDSCGKPT